MTFRHVFVETIPKELEPGVLYVSMEFATVIHACACGCGNRVVTRLSPKNWQLTFDGRSISLHPSVGNWSFPCRSHYWIRHDEVVWAEPWEEYSRAQVHRPDEAVSATDLEPVHVEVQDLSRVPWYRQLWNQALRLLSLKGGSD